MSRLDVVVVKVVLVVDAFVTTSEVLSDVLIFSVVISC